MHQVAGGAGGTVVEPGLVQVLCIRRAAVEGQGVLGGRRKRQGGRLHAMLLCHSGEEALQVAAPAVERVLVHGIPQAPGAHVHRRGHLPHGGHVLHIAPLPLAAGPQPEHCQQVWQAVIGARQCARGHPVHVDLADRVACNLLFGGLGR